MSRALLADRAIAGFTVNRARLAEALERNPILVTALNPVIGYEKGAAIAKKAYAEGKPIREVAAAMTELPREQLDAAARSRPNSPAEASRAAAAAGAEGAHGATVPAGISRRDWQRAIAHSLKCSARP